MMIFFYFQANGSRARRVGFSTESQFLEYFTPRRSTHHVFEAACDNGEAQGYMPMPMDWAKGHEALYPMCEHGMDLQSCYGPEHWMSADQERAMGWQ